MQITVVRIWLLSHIPGHTRSLALAAASPPEPLNDDQVVVIGLREILGAIHFHCILKSAFLRSLKKKAMERKQFNSKSSISEKVLWKDPSLKKNRRHFQKEKHSLSHHSTQWGNVHPFLNGDQLPALWWDCPHAPSMWQTVTVTGLEVFLRNYGPDGPKELTPELSLSLISSFFPRIFKLCFKLDFKTPVLYVFLVDSIQFGKHFILSSQR